MLEVFRGYTDISCNHFVINVHPYGKAVDAIYLGGCFSDSDLFGQLLENLPSFQLITYVDLFIGWLVLPIQLTEVHFLWIKKHNTKFCNKFVKNSESQVDCLKITLLPGPGGEGTWVFFWVGMCHPGLQIGTPF